MTASEIRRRVEDHIEALIALLDQIDGDPDFELETDFDINPITLQGVNRVPPKRITMRRAA